MKNINLLYEGKEMITDLISQGKLNSHMPYFIQIITASEGPKQSLEIARFVQESFPNATIMGFSACGLIYEGVQHSEGTLILFKLFEKTNLFQACFSWDGKSGAEVAKEVADAISTMDTKLMHVVCGDYYYDVHDFVEEFNKLNNHTAMVGGVAGDILSDNTPAFIFTSEKIIEKGIIISAFCGNDLSVYKGVNTSHEAISGKYQLTKIEDGVWKEVNGQNIKNWLFDHLGIDDFVDYSDWEAICANDMLVHFPMILEGFQGASRFLRYDMQSDSITQYFSRIPEGTEFRIGYVNPTECLQESFRLSSEVISQPIEDLFCYTCLFRRLYLQNCSDWELSPYKNNGLCGAFMMGEISNINGHNELLNGSCCLVGIAENEVYIRPDIQVYEKLTAIGDDTTDLLNMVLKRQQESTSRQNEELMKTLLEQRDNQEKQMYVDFNTGIANYIKYSEDIKTQRFDKFCVIKIENAELLTTHLGHISYLKIMRKAMQLILQSVLDCCNNEHALLELYVFNEVSVFIAADERMSRSHFMRICNQLYDEYHLFHTEGEEVLVNRFALCMNQTDPLERALNALTASKNTQNSFLVCEEEEDGSSSDEEFKMIGVLNRAFENDGIIPYFQGIHNNKNKQINYYEALIRIQDVNGDMYMPGQFLDIAKKYHMYSILSTKMLNKIFDYFADRADIVSINICAFDIQSEETKEMIYKRLENSKYPKSYVFEILEDESYFDFNPLKEFIRKVREYGARVAIDDFGAGYSNLYEISNISFDIIKVDGSIIRNLPEKQCNRKLLDVITHMGLLFNAEIVAEFVENQVIQDIIEETGIEYSQGYLFAKPLPFEELGLE